MTRTSARPALPHPGATEHYRDGHAYDVRYQGRSEDIAFYRRWAGLSSTVLEYGAGTGRLTLPLAKRGCRITAVDLSAQMLAVLQARLAAESHELRKRVELKCADMRTFQTRSRYQCVIVGFHTFCHLYHRDDVTGFLRLAFSHLEPGGRLALDVPMPRIDAVGYDPLSQVCVAEMDGPFGSELLTQRWFQPQELRMHLLAAGFERVRIHGDFRAAPPNEDTDFLLFEARRPPC